MKMVSDAPMTTTLQARSPAGAAGNSSHTLRQRDLEEEEESEGGGDQELLNRSSSTGRSSEEEEV